MKNYCHLMIRAITPPGTRYRAQAGWWVPRIILAGFGLIVLVLLSYLPSVGAGTSGAGMKIQAGTQVEAPASEALGSNKSPWVPVCEIQGRGFTSPYEGQTVRTGGVVVALKSFRFKGRAHL